MAEAFADLNRGLNNLLWHADLEVVQRADEDRHVSLEPVTLLLTLLLEQAAGSKGFSAWRRILTWNDGDLWHFILAHGEPSGRCPVEAGQLVRWNRAGKTHTGIVTGAEGGSARQLVEAMNAVTVVEEEVGPEDVTFAWTPSLGARKLESAFYGEKSAFLALVQVTDRVVIEPAMIEELSANAPSWVKERIGRAGGDHEALRRVLDTLGDGVEDFAGEAPPGTWAFLDRDEVGFVVVSSPDDVPLMVMQEGNTNPIFNDVDPGWIERIWRPSIEPRRYVDGKSDVFADLNAAIGRLRLWGEGKVQIMDPLFTEGDLHAMMTPDAAKVVRRGPTDLDEWPDYAKSTGKLSAEAARPGDLLLLDDGTQAIALDEGEMLLQPESGELSIRPLPKSAQVWKTV